MSVGEAEVLHFSSDIDGYNRNVAFIQLDRSSNNIRIRDEHIKEWETERQRLKGDGLSGGKCSVRRLSITYPFVSDTVINPPINVEWSLIDYSEMRAFTNVVCGDRETRAQYVNDAHQVMNEIGTHIPNALCQYVSVILRDAVHGRVMLLLHRREKSAPGYIFPNCWSATAEMTLHPVKTRYDEQEYDADLGLTKSVERLVKDEIMGEGDFGPMEIKTHALLMETPILNFGFLTVVDFPEFPDRGLKKTKVWQKIGNDSEYDAIITLPLTDEVVKDCVRAAGLPETLWGQLEGTGKQTFAVRDHAWHPVTKIRMAHTLWYRRTFLDVE
jgi:hypothetical protein